MSKFTLTIATDNASLLSSILAACEGDAGTYTETIGGTVRVEPKSTSDTVRVTATDQMPGEVPKMTAEVENDDGPADANAPDVDKRGFPWDERIHASSKAVNKDGTWRYKRNTSQETIDAVEAELKPDDMPPVPEAFQRTAAPVPVPTGEPATSVTYEQVIAEMTDALQGGKIAPEALPGLYQQCGVSGAHELVGNQPALDAAHAKLAAL